MRNGHAITDPICDSTLGPWLTDSEAYSRRSSYSAQDEDKDPQHGVMDIETAILR